MEEIHSNPHKDAISHFRISFQVTTEQPPTFFRTNKFTSAFQELINSYGVASYREANPAVYTIITFPFLFSVMFGDSGHGVIMLCFGLWMCLKEKQLAARKIDSDIWRIFFAGRYLITIMSFFSIYAGLIYNDVFSKSLNVFGSSWYPQQSKDVVLNIKEDMISPQTGGYYGTPYPFGVDPIWQVSENKIVVLNAFKMKLSIILGVIHMLFGVCMSYSNAQYFKRPLNIFAEFIPQVTYTNFPMQDLHHKYQLQFQFIFMICLFGYLGLMMFHKWTLYSADAEDRQYSERCAPSLLITFINMVLFSEQPVEEGCDTGYMFAGQKHIQRLLVIIAVCCVPIMLFAKPLAQRKAHNARAGARSVPVNGADGTQSQAAEETFEFSEVMILQGIHTIEYVLGSVSHTASYLRLWALSLAHAQLSEVLWVMVLRNGLNINGW